VTAARLPEPHAVLDGGERRCGELLIALKLEMDRLRSGEILKLVSRDPAAPEEIPAWCRMTGHRLVGAADGTFYIVRKEA
jgi:tRNA 2-thiouridine synthesizing protein A